MSELVERLREEPRLHEKSNGLTSVEMMVWHKTCLEAADEIERQANRIEELEHMLTHALRREETLRETIERLRAVRDAAVDYLEGTHVSGISEYKKKAALIMAIKKAALREDEK